MKWCMYLRSLCPHNSLEYVCVSRTCVGPPKDAILTYCNAKLAIPCRVCTKISKTSFGFQWGPPSLLNVFAVSKSSARTLDGKYMKLSTQTTRSADFGNDDPVHHTSHRQNGKIHASL